jgi:tRNA threonylcarbamoyladenosine biosynthesis protein TsaE
VEVFLTKSPAETQELGGRLARSLTAGDVVGFIGELGSGKTTLIKGIAAGLEVKEIVKSPSFVIITQYAGRLPVYHIDLYRLDRPTEVMELELEEYFYNSGICLVEWADRIAGFLPDQAIRITLEVAGPAERKITVDSQKQLNV